MHGERDGEIAATGDPVTYSSRATIVIAAPPREIARWLVDPQLMSRWMGAGRVVAETDGPPAVGARVCLDVAGSGGVGGAFAGELVEFGDRRVVRRYELAASRSLYGKLARTAGGFSRTVTYALGEAPWPQLGEPIPARRGIEVACTIETRIPGTAPIALALAGRAEEKALAQALVRLRDGVEGRRRGLFRRLRERGQLALAL